jgi:hypothetical protein
MKYLITFILAGLSYISHSQIIYLTDSKYEADYICTIVSNKYEADWLIHINDWKRYSQQNHGNWYLTRYKPEATFKIYLSSGYYGGGDKARKIFFVCNQHEATLNDNY